MKRKFVIIVDYFLIVAAFSISTELFAYLCNYSQALGPKDFIVLYQPFQILVWTFTINAPANQFFISYAVLITLVTIILVVSITLYNKFKVKTSTLHGSSRMATNAELKKIGLFSQGGVILGQSNKASYKETYDPGQNKLIYTLTRPGDLIFSNDEYHLLCVAPTGSGKGISFVIPSLLSWTGSAVIYDIKKENFDITAGWRKTFSHVFRFEPAAPYSARFNPLLEIDKGPNEIGQAQNVATIICDPNGDGKFDHWQKTAQQLLVGVIIHILYAGENKTLSGLYEFLNNPNLPIRKSLDLMLETKHLGYSTHPVVAQVARNLLNKSDNELSGVISTASSFLSLYQDPYIQQNTATSDFTINQLMNADNPVSLYIVVSPKDTDRMRPLTRLILQMIGKKLTEKNKSFKHRLLFLIDEFPTLGNLEFFETQLAFFRSYGIKCALITQSYSQLYKHYSKDTSIIDNCHYKIILGADNPTEAKMISEFLGQETLIKKNSSISGKLSGLLMSNKSVSESEMGRYLMTTDEILHMPFEDMIFLCGGMYPYYGRKVMYYGDDRFIVRANLPKPENKQDQEKEFIKSDPSVWFKQKTAQKAHVVEEPKPASVSPGNKEEVKVTVPEDKVSSNNIKKAETFNKLEL